jgi:hypothetical protein
VSGFGLRMIPFAIGMSLLLADNLRRLGWFLIWPPPGPSGRASCRT